MELISIYDPHNLGSWKGHSTGTILLKMKEDILRAMKEKQVEFGVWQGSILGPVLFNLYVTTISGNSRSTYLVYADDTTLLRHTKG